MLIIVKLLCYIILIPQAVVTFWGHFKKPMTLSPSINTHLVLRVVDGDLVTVAVEPRDLDVTTVTRPTEQLDVIAFVLNALRCPHVYLGRFHCK